MKCWKIPLEYNIKKIKKVRKNSTLVFIVEIFLSIILNVCFRLFNNSHKIKTNYLLKCSTMNWSQFFKKVKFQFNKISERLFIKKNVCIILIRIIRQIVMNLSFELIQMIILSVFITLKIVVGLFVFLDVEIKSIFEQD